eukprot:2131456-Amphidinium_carterae.2
MNGGDSVRKNAHGEGVPSSGLLPEAQIGSATTSDVMKSRGWLHNHGSQGQTLASRPNLLSRWAGVLEPVPTSNSASS